MMSNSAELEIKQERVTLFVCAIFIFSYILVNTQAVVSQLVKPVLNIIYIMRFVDIRIHE